MSMTKDEYHEGINEPKLKRIEDVCQYWQDQIKTEEKLKYKPLSDCCNSDVSHIETNGGSVSICNQCKSFCKIH